MLEIHDATRAPRGFVTRELVMVSHGLGWAATAVMLAATMVIAFAAPV